MRYQMYETIEQLKEEFEFHYKNAYELANIIDYEFSDGGMGADDTSVETVTKHLFSELDSGEYVTIRIFLERFSPLEDESEIIGSRDECIRDLEQEDNDSNWVHLLIQEEDTGYVISVLFHATYIFGFAHSMSERWM